MSDPMVRVIECYVARGDGDYDFTIKTDDGDTLFGPVVRPGPVVEGDQHGDAIYLRRTTL